VSEEMKKNRWPCALPWVHLRQNSDGHFSPCCNFVENPSSLPQGVSYREAFHSDFFRGLRESFLKGKDIPQCSRCVIREKSGSESMREKSLHEFGEAWNANPEIRYLELNLGNLCNLKCRGCDSSSSSKWIQDEIKMGISPSREFEFRLEDLDHSLVSLEKVKILGGEPFLSPKHQLLLQKLDSEKGIENISLQYSTNGTVRVSENVLKIWEKAKSLSISFSVDGKGEQNDLFRDGSHWNEWIENIRWFEKNVKNSQIDFTFHTVVNIYNIFSIEELDNFLSSEFPNFWLTKDCLVSPSWLDIRNLPKEIKRECSEKFSGLAQKYQHVRKRWQSYSYIEKFLQESANDTFLSFARKHLELNRIRNIESAPLSSRLEDLLKNVSKELIEDQSSWVGVELR
jgi:sulfatase maturation enzyme AslB (radical SAM superfamily)